MEKIIIADADERACQWLKRGLREHYTIAGVVHDGAELYHAVKRIRPDAVVTDLILPRFDGMDVIKQMRCAFAQTPRILIYSAFYSEEVIKQLYAMGASYLQKPGTIEDVMKRLSAKAPLGTGYEIMDEGALIDRIGLMLKEVGVKPKLCGYRYMLCGILMMIKEREGAKRAGRLYAEIAKRFQTTPYNIERSIRYGVESAFETGDLAAIEKLFGYTVDPRKGKPTNLEFISTLADRVLLP